jgi:hypothetical protein
LSSVAIFPPVTLSFEGITALVTFQLREGLRSGCGRAGTRNGNMSVSNRYG